MLIQKPMLFFLILTSIFSAVEHFTLANTLYVDKNEITINASFKGDVINLYGIKEDSGSTIVILKGQKSVISKKRRLSSDSDGSLNYLHSKNQD